jgi:hypothetical protein
MRAARFTQRGTRCMPDTDASANPWWHHGTPSCHHDGANRMLQRPHRNGSAGHPAVPALARAAAHLEVIQRSPGAGQHRRATSTMVQAPQMQPLAGHATLRRLRRPAGTTARWHDVMVTWWRTRGHTPYRGSPAAPRRRTVRVAAGGRRTRVARLLTLRQTRPTRSCRRAIAASCWYDGCWADWGAPAVRRDRCHPASRIVAERRLCRCLLAMRAWSRMRMRPAAPPAELRGLPRRSARLGARWEA